MEKLKVMVVVGTRPEIIRLSEVIKAIDKYFNLVLVHTGQNYDYTLNEIFFKEFGLKNPDYYLSSPGKNLGETVKTEPPISYSSSFSFRIFSSTSFIFACQTSRECPIFSIALRLKISEDIGIMK